MSSRHSAPAAEGRQDAAEGRRPKGRTPQGCSEAGENGGQCELALRGRHAPSANFHRARRARWSHWGDSAPVRLWLVLVVVAVWAFVIKVS